MADATISQEGVQEVAEQTDFQKYLKTNPEFSEHFFKVMVTLFNHP